jgi:hypothetical protein
MPRSGKPNPLPETLVNITDRQDGSCAGVGCNTKIPNRNSVVQHIRPRTKDGTDKESNLVILCRTCAGMTTRTFNLPQHLINSTRLWLKENLDVGSLSQLVRDAVAIHITSPENRIDISEHKRVKRELIELKNEVSKEREEKEREFEKLNVIIEDNRRKAEEFAESIRGPKKRRVLSGEDPNWLGGKSQSEQPKYNPLKKG